MSDDSTYENVCTNCGNPKDAPYLALCEYCDLKRRSGEDLEDTVISIAALSYGMGFFDD